MRRQILPVYGMTIHNPNGNFKKAISQFCIKALQCHFLNITLVISHCFRESCVEFIWEFLIFVFAPIQS